MDWILAIAVVAAAFLVGRAIDASAAEVSRAVTPNSILVERRFVCSLAAQLAAAELGNPAYRRELSKLRSAAHDAALAPLAVTVKHIGTHTTETHDYSDEQAAAKGLASDLSEMARDFDVLQSPQRHVEAAWRIYELVRDEQARQNE